MKIKEATGCVARSNLFDHLQNTPCQSSRLKKVLSCATLDEITIPTSSHCFLFSNPIKYTRNTIKLTQVEEKTAFKASCAEPESSDLL